jgi:phage tail-like protein
MANITVNVHRFDPYKNFKFRVFWEGSNAPVAGIGRVSSLGRSAEVFEHRDGGDGSFGHKSPGRTEYEAITLERGVTHDTEFEHWASYASGPGAGTAPRDLRRNVLIEIYNEAGQLVERYKVFRCWVSEYQSLPDLDGNANAVAIQHIKLENEGWERDDEVPEPRDPKSRSLRRKSS